MNPRLSPKTCACGAEFIGGPTAKYCPSCRAERIRQHDRERHQRRLAGRIRTLGSTDKCAICGQDYTVNSGPQKHCPACQVAEAKKRRHDLWVSEYYNDPIKRRRMIENSRQWAIKYPDRVRVASHMNYLNNKAKKTDQRRKMYGVKLRPLGRTEVCPKCANDFIVLERNQKYCDLCRQNDRSP